MSTDRSDFPPGATTLHLAPADIWARAKSERHYVPDAFAADGFVHCTNGDDEVIAVGNRYYRSDARAYVVLTVAIDKLTAPVKYDDSAHRFPHVYGPIDRAAIMAERMVNRTDDGVFVSIAPEAETP